MNLLRIAPVRVAVPILLGVAIMGAMFLPAVFSVAAEEGEELGSGMVGAALLLSPYVLFAFAGPRTRAARGRQRQQPLKWRIGASWSMPQAAGPTSGEPRHQASVAGDRPTHRISQASSRSQPHRPAAPLRRRASATA